MTRGALRLPITVYVEHALPGDWYVADATAIRALREPGLAAASPGEGRLWMGLPRMREFAHERPSLFQFLPRWPVAF